MTATTARGSETSSTEADEPTDLLVGLYHRHYLGLLRLAVLCVDSRPLAEDIVQDAFIAVYQARNRLVRPESVLVYLRKTVLNRALLRSALARLPPRQREAVVLRHYADLSEKQTAEVMGVGAGAVKAHCSRGLAALEHILGEMDR